MHTLICFFIALLLCFPSFMNAQNKMKVKAYNFSSFTLNEKKQNNVLQKVASQAEQQHPEWGILPYNAQCSDCFEQLEKRSLNERFFIKNGSNGNHFYVQKSYFPLHYKNQKNQWITIDSRLKPFSKDEFKAPHQNFPTTYNTSLHATSIQVSDFTFLFNQNWQLAFAQNNKKLIDFKAADFSNFSAGDDGIKIIEAWKGVNITHVYQLGGIKTNFIFEEKITPPPYAEYIVWSDNLNLPENYYLKKIGHTIGLFNNQNQHIITFHPSVYYDSNHQGGVGEYNFFQNDPNNWTIQIWVPTNFFNQKTLHYPVTVDPLVSAGPQGIGEFEVPFPATFNSANMGFTLASLGSCDFDIVFNGLGGANLVNTFLDVEYENRFNPCDPNGNPPFCEFTDVSMEVIGPCGISTGQLSCNPSQPPFNGTCTTDPNKVPGAGAIPIPNFLNCITPQCLDYSLTFTIKNRVFRCNDICDINCATGHRFAVTIEGRTLEEQVTITDDSICAGQAVEVISLPRFGVPPYTYLWNPTGDTDSTITVRPEVSTFYEAIVTDQCGNTANADTLIHVTPSPDANAGDLFTVCENGTVGIGGNPTSIDGFTFEWTAIPPADINYLSSNTISNPAFFAPLNNIGILEYTVRVSNGTCFREDTASIQINPLPSPTINPDSNVLICDGQAALLQTDSLYDTYLWSTGENTPSILISTPQTVSVTVTKNNCSGSSNLVNVEEKPPLAFEVLPPVSTLNLGESLLLSSDIDLNAPDISRFFWFPDLEISCTNCIEPNVFPSENRFYFLTIEKDGCTFTDSALVQILFPNNFVIPSAFSPNNDGKNDRFFIIKQSGVEVLEFKIFNRWGELLHNRPLPWDGTHKGVLQDIEVFHYFFKLLLSGNEERVVKGNVTLLR